MAQPVEDITVKPEVTLLEDLLAEVSTGKLRVPRFQRPFVWRAEQMTNLFDSIERGYPIGSLLIWDTQEKIPSLDEIANRPIPGVGSRSTVSYVLDGHQRLSTLFGTLMRPLPAEELMQDDWRWDMYRELGNREVRANKFRHWKSDRVPPPDYLPLRAVLRTMDFLSFARNVQSRVDSPEEASLYISEGEALAQRIKSYKISVVRLVGGSLAQAVEVFSRLNSSGQSMTPDQMVSALTYSAGPDEESLADRIDDIRESIEATGFGEIPPITIFRSVLAVAGEEDIQEARWAALAQRVRGRLDIAVQETEPAMRKATSFLEQAIRVPIARLVPYNAQLVLLSAFFHYDQAPTARKLERLAQWFWLTSWGGTFAGANTTQIRNALQEMKEFAVGDTELDLSGTAPRGFPARFDSRSARVRILLVWQLNEFPHALDLAGRPLDVVESLRASDTQAYRHIVSRSADYGSNPANRIIMPTRPGISLRLALLRADEENGADVSGSNGIPPEALEALKYGENDRFIIDRAEFLAARERAFMRRWTAGVAPATEWDSAEVDTE